MDERNMVCTSQLADMEIDRQAQDHLHPEPCYYLGNNGHYPHANMYRMPPTSGSTSNIDPRQFPNNHESSVFYGGQYSGIQHHNPMNMDLGPSSNFHNPCIIPPPGTGVFPVPHVSSDQLSSSGHPGFVGFGLNEFVGNHHFVEGVRSSGKRKNAEVVPGNYHHFNGTASSTSSTLGTPPSISGLLQSEGQSEAGPSVPDTAASTPPEYVMNGMLPITAGRSTRSVRSRSNALGLQMEPPIVHSMNHLVQGNYLGQPFQQTTWVEQQFGNTGNEGSTSSWSYSPAIPYLNGGSVNGVPSDVPSMGGQGYSDNRNSTVLLNPPMHPHPHPHQQHHFHPCPPAMQAMHVHNTYQIQPLMPSFRHPTGNTLQHGTLNHSLDDSEIGSRHTRTFPANGLRLYRPHRNGPHQAVPANINRPHLRYMSEEEVAILEFPGFYEVGSSTDRHRDMRLDIDDMSYEELLALGERIGNVVTGFPEETISSHLKTKVYHSTTTKDTNNETETCTVCQVEFKDAEKVGSLDCGHEYHVDCIKRWLQVKNVCPICKVPAINVEK